MKFITESDLRALYKEQPFDSYVPQTGTKITPGARQFLIDRKVKIADGMAQKRISKQKEETPLEPRAQAISIPKRRICCRLASAEAVCLTTAQQLLAKDIPIVQQIIELSGELSQIKTVLESGGVFSDFTYPGCTGIHGENSGCDLGDCFPITGFHIQLEKGQEIILLHQLRCALREMCIDMLELQEQEKADDSPYQTAYEQTNRIINRLSQLICTASGGKVCRRKT